MYFDVASRCLKIPSAFVNAALNTSNFVTESHAGQRIQSQSAFVYTSEMEGNKVFLSCCFF